MTDREEQGKRIDDPDIVDYLTIFEAYTKAPVEERDHMLVGELLADARDRIAPPPPKTPRPRHGPRS
jgi:hypothetical protein